jgi:Transposase DDE domain
LSAGAVWPSRDHRSDRLQIVYGLLCTREGLPIAIEVFDGNAADPTTLKAQIDKLKGRFAITRIVMIGDRGMITKARIRDDLVPSGLDWITCLRAPQIQALAQEGGPLQLSLSPTCRPCHRAERAQPRRSSCGRTLQLPHLLHRSRFTKAAIARVRRIDNAAPVRKPHAVADFVIVEGYDGPRP